MSTLRPVALAAFALACWTHASAARAESSFDPEARLAELKLTLPPREAPVGNFVPAVRSGNLLFLAGHAQCDQAIIGKVGGSVTPEQAYAAAKLTGLCLLATLKAELGDLRKVKRIVKVLGMVNAVPQFKDHPKVVNGCSDLFVAVFGDRGRHARSAVGMASLPDDTVVEIEMVVEIDAAG
ncbi:MAG TPA: RidA family protein [Steroidobacteraceae bacterium]|nr:RidA family protein [Steroidobacteraceae bacterium]